MVGICEVCGNETEQALAVTVAGALHVFDTFDCAIQALAPVCERCGRTITGQALRREGGVYCSRECAEWLAPAALGALALPDAPRLPGAPGSGWVGQADESSPHAIIIAPAPLDGALDNETALSMYMTDTSWLPSAEDIPAPAPSKEPASA